MFYVLHCLFCVIQGGRHIDYVVDQIVAKLIEVVKKKNKAGVSVKPFQVIHYHLIHVLLLCYYNSVTSNSIVSELG